MILSSAIVFALLATATVWCGIAKPGCSIKMTGGLSSKQPLLLDLSKQLYLPLSDGYVYLKNAKTIRLVCTGVNNFFDGRIFAPQKPRDIEVTCYEKTNFIYKSQLVDFKKFECKRIAECSLVRTAKICQGLGSAETEYLLELVFDVDRNFRIVIMKICFDIHALTVMWTSYKLVSVIKGAQTGVGDRRKFKDFNSFPGLDIDSLYEKRKQFDTFQRLLGPIRASQVMNISPGSTYFLAKGHLTAKTDFVYGSWQDSTFAIINAAPQWQVINQGNWLQVEKRVREYAHSLGKDLQVQTGVHGVLKLSNERNVPTPLYLHYDPGVSKTNAYQVPVPMLFWKTVKGRDLLSVTIVCINNPHFKLEDISDRNANNGYKLPGCNNVNDCARHTWLHGFDKSFSRGFIYCCDRTDGGMIATDYWLN